MYSAHVAFLTEQLYSVAILKKWISSFSFIDQIKIRLSLTRRQLLCM
jgi:hypothetical protein